MKLSEITDVKSFLKGAQDRVNLIKSLKHGAHITVKLAWVKEKQPYIVHAVVEGGVYKDEHGREVQQHTKGMKLHVRVKYRTHDGHEVDTTMSEDYLLDNLISVDAVRAGRK